MGGVVSGLGKEAVEEGASSHVQDAKTAVALFARALPRPKSSIDGTENPLSLIAAAALWSGWTDDSAMLRNECLVLKAGPAAGCP
jgi:hypothetical protein